MSGEAIRARRLANRLLSEADLYQSITQGLIDEAKRQFANAIAVEAGRKPAPRPRTVLRDMRH